ncbi:MAG TPA: alpha/beta hydrolase [Xanthobacteraceae bacterium]|jgi:3-oxoadipate enol-lactonase|nr:alpha/beta hydrolase [Xanthobacteraceae bacterium]
MPFSRANGVDIWYEVAGDGPALVLVHANPFDNTLWMYQTAHYSTWFKVVTIDIRGYGRSVKQTTPYTLADMSNDVIGVMKDAGVDRAILGGCSVGSSIALLAGLDHPDLFDAIILVGGNSRASERFGQRIEGYTRDLRDYHVKHLRMLVEETFSSSRLGAYLLNRYVERQPRLKGEAIAQVFRAANGMSVTDRLGTMRVPTLVINGETDHSRPAGEETARLIPGAVHKVLPGTGHACCLEDPAGFDAILTAFLEQRGLMPKL